MILTGRGALNLGTRWPIIPREKKTLTVKAVKPGQQTYSNKSACMMLLGLATRQFLCLRPTAEQWVNTGALCGEWV